jgi:hypothetical protein
MARAERRSRSLPARSLPGQVSDNCAWSDPWPLISRCIHREREARCRGEAGPDGQGPTRPIVGKRHASGRARAGNLGRSEEGPKVG